MGNDKNTTQEAAQLLREGDLLKLSHANFLLRLKCMKRPCSYKEVKFRAQSPQEEAQEIKFADFLQYYNYES